MSNLYTQLSHLDNLLRAGATYYLSLNPKKSIPTPFASFESLLVANLTSDQIERVLQALTALVEKQLAYYPNNIFWDYDYFIHSQMKRVQSMNDIAYDVYYEKLYVIMELFGNSSNIRFQYMHDFIYGFDWSRWVKSDIELRKNTCPFDEVFLDYLYQRGNELLALIEENDKKYHALAIQEYRNPYSFSRDIAQETKLLQTLSSEELVPLKLWDPHTDPIWDKPYYEMRKKIASTL